MKRLVVALTAGIALSLLAVAAAAAHAELESSIPGDGATIDQLPAAVELTFSEVVGNPAALTVVGPDGEPIETGELAIADRTISQPVATAGSPSGAYTISYQVTSADGHVIGGTVVFTATGGAGGGDASVGAPPAAGSDDGVEPLVVASLLTALAVALGFAVIGLQHTVRRMAADNMV